MAGSPLGPYRSTPVDSFLLRVWHDASDSAWKARVVNVADQATVEVVDLAGIAEFIGRYVPGFAAPGVGGRPPSPPTAPPPPPKSAPTREEHP